MFHLFFDVFFEHKSYERRILSNIFCIAALEKAIGLAVADADIATICGEVDNFINEEL